MWQFLSKSEKIFLTHCMTFLTIRGQIENEDEKIWENDIDFRILHTKIRLYERFIKI